MEFSIASLTPIFSQRSSSHKKKSLKDCWALSFPIYQSLKYYMFFLAEEKLKWAFKLYDVDCSGTITQDEMILIFEKLCRFSFSKTLLGGNEWRLHNYKSYQISKERSGLLAGRCQRKKLRREKAALMGRVLKGRRKKWEKESLLKRQQQQTM